MGKHDLAQLQELFSTLFFVCFRCCRLLRAPKPVRRCRDANPDAAMEIRVMPKTIKSGDAGNDGGFGV